MTLKFLRRKKSVSIVSTVTSVSKPAGPDTPVTPETVELASNALSKHGLAIAIQIGVTPCHQ